MRRRDVVGLALSGCGFTLKSAEAQVTPGRVYRVGLLCARRVGREDSDGKAFVEELARLGFVEGKNLRLMWAGDVWRNAVELRQAADELVALKVDVITTWCGTPGAQAAKQATLSIPVVFSSSADPVTLGLVESLGRPGGNVTGFTGRDSDMVAKSLEMLVQAVPSIKRVAILHHSSTRGLPWFHVFESSLPATGRALGVRTEFVDVPDAAGLDPVITRLAQQGFNGLVFLSGNLTPPGFMELGQAIASKNRLPFTGSLELGALVRVSADDTAKPLRVARYAAKILGGARPADLPVDQPTAIKLRINLKAAQALGISIPQALLLRADEVIR